MTPFPRLLARPSLSFPAPPSRLLPFFLLLPSAGDWESRWVTESNWKPVAERGTWTHTGGKYPGAVGDKGIQTSPDARFHIASAMMSESFDNAGKDLVISYTVKHEQDLDCGGAYLKLLPAGFDQKTFSGDSAYSIMFGPDVCGYSTRKTHVIFGYKGQNLLTKKNIRCETDKLSHRYTLIVRPDNTYEVQVSSSCCSCCPPSSLLFKWPRWRFLCFVEAPLVAPLPRFYPSPFPSPDPFHPSLPSFLPPSLLFVRSIDSSLFCRSTAPRSRAATSPTTGTS